MKVVVAAAADAISDDGRDAVPVLIDALAQAMPEAAFVTPAATRADAGAVVAAVVANPPPRSLQQLPNLRLVQSLWAGVDRLLADPTLPPGVPVARLVDPSMGAAMSETALWAVIGLQRGFFAYQRQQHDGIWRRRPARRAGDVAVLVLGGGAMGCAIAARLAQHGCLLDVWRRRDGALAPARIGGADIVCNVLPLTPATRAIVDARFIAAMKRGAALLNFGRGAHVVDADLLAALDDGHVEHAVLDVFATEPLPRDHRYWRHPRVTVLPHDAAPTALASAVAIAVANLRALAAGQPVAHLVDRTRGY